MTVLIKLLLIGTVAGGYLWLIEDIALDAAPGTEGFILAGWLLFVAPTVYLIWRLDARR